MVEKRKEEVDVKSFFVVEGEESVIYEKYGFVIFRILVSHYKQRYILLFRILVWHANA